MVGPGRRGDALLLGLTVGAVLVGGAVVAVPAGALPAGWEGLLSARPARTGTEVTVPTPAPPPTRRRIVVDLPEPLPPPTTLAVPTAAPPPPTTRPPRPRGPAAEVVAATNAARREAGCPALGTDVALARAAQGHAADMAESDFFSHTGDDGREFDERIRDAGHPSPGAENIAQGQQSATEVVEGWMDSPGHRENILDCSLTEIGVGYDARGDYWVQDFGR